MNVSELILETANLSFGTKSAIRPVTVSYSRPIITPIPYCSELLDASDILDITPFKIVIDSSSVTEPEQKHTLFKPRLYPAI